MINRHSWLLSDLDLIPKNDIKVFSTFSCGGGSSFGYELNGCEVIAANDIDPQMAYHYRLNHNPKYYYLCPIKDLLTRDLPDELFGIDILDSSPPCFAKGTPVITSEGVKNIEEIKEGDLVLTHKGRWKPVLKTMTRLSETIWIDNRIETTPDHPFYTKFSNRDYKQTTSLSDNPEWTAAKDCEGKFLGLPVEIEKLDLPEPPERFVYNKSFWYFVGRWIGDGWIRYEEGSNEPYKKRERYVDSCKPCIVCGKDSLPHGRYNGWWTNYCSIKCKGIESRKRKRPKYEVLICSSFDEGDSLYLKLSELNVKIGRKTEATTERFRISSKALVHWLMQYFGRYASGKNLPGFIYSMRKEWKESFLQGYIDADGFEFGENNVTLTSIGRNLICGIMQLAVTMDYSICIQKKMPQNNLIEGRKVNVKQSYALSLTKNNRYVSYSHNIQWRKLRRKTRPASELTQVYDIEVADDHSFIADGFIVHNCSLFSDSGDREKKWGKLTHFREGQQKQILDELFFDYLDLVERLKPKVTIAENVKGLIKGNAKWYVKLIYERYKEIGYTPQLFLINSADCGVPQIRERVFFCAIRNDLFKQKLILNPTEKWVSCGEATNDIQDLTDEEIERTKISEKANKLWKLTKNGSTFGKTNLILTGKETSFNTKKLDDKKPSNTLQGNDCILHWNQPRKLTLREWIRLGTFPDDYKFKNPKIGKYMIGMSVPPKMMQYVSGEVIKQWLIN